MKTRKEELIELARAQRREADALVAGLYTQQSFEEGLDNAGLLGPNDFVDLHEKPDGTLVATHARYTEEEPLRAPDKT